MNRRRQEPLSRISPIVIFSFILAGAIGASGGISYVYFRNKQIQTVREIDVIERRIEHHQLGIRTVQMRADQILNLFAIRTTLEEVGTELVAIPSGAAENVLPTEPTAVADATTSL